MKKHFRNFVLAGSILYIFSNCTVSYINTDKLIQNYEKKKTHTTTSRCT